MKNKCQQLTKTSGPYPPRFFFFFNFVAKIVKNMFIKKVMPPPTRIFIGVSTHNNYDVKVQQVKTFNVVYKYCIIY